MLQFAWEVADLGTKEQMLILFENNKGVFFSGEDIAEKLSVSRTAVWKAVKSLRSEGYHIDAVQNKGYSLSVDTDIISERGIRKYLKPICSDITIEIASTLNSTNEKAREKAIAGVPEGYTVIALNQTNGKGRRGRSFYSPADTGLYMSLLLRPYQYAAHKATQLTTIAAIAACEAIEKVSDEKAEIKWVNDVYVGGKKVSGILTEASIALENGFLEYAILGIGINVSPPKDGFPHGLNHVAGTIFHKPQSDGKNKLAAEFLNRFMVYYSTPQNQNLVENYRKRSLVIGKEIQVISIDDCKPATALDIDDDYRLVVEYEDGKIEHLLSGEISVKVS